MKKLELKQTAFALAASTVTQSLAALDAAVSAKASESKLTDQDYIQFRSDAIQYRNGLLPAYQADQSAAAKASAPAPKPAPAATTAPKT